MLVATNAPPPPVAVKSAEPGASILTASPIVQFIMKSGGRLSAWMILVYCCSEVAVAIYTKDIVHGFHAIGWVALAIGGLSIVYHQKRGTDMIATGVAEIKEALPGLTTPSTDPAIRSAEQTVVAAAILKRESGSHKFDGMP